MDQRGAGRWRIAVDDNCIGSGSCVGVAPHHFELGEDDRSHPLAPEVPADEQVRDAAASCPMEAISVHDAQSGKPLEP